MFFELAKIRYNAAAAEKMCSMLSPIYDTICEEILDFNWGDIPEFDKTHYKKVFSMVYDGACPVKSVPITDEVLKRELWDHACCYTVSDKNNNLAYTYLVGKKRSDKTVLSDKTANAIGLHVGDLNGVKIKDNFLSKILGVLLFDVAFPNSSINFKNVPEIVRMRLFNDSRNTIDRKGKTYDLYDKDGSLILSAKARKTFFTRRDTARIKYPRNGIKIFEKPSIAERKWVLDRLSELYNAKSK